MPVRSDSTPAGRRFFFRDVLHTREDALTAPRRACSALTIVTAVLPSAFASLRPSGQFAASQCWAVCAHALHAAHAGPRAARVFAQVKHDGELVAGRGGDCAVEACEQRRERGLANARVVLADVDDDHGAPVQVVQRRPADQLCGCARAGRVKRRGGGGQPWRCRTPLRALRASARARARDALRCSISSAMSCAGALNAGRPSRHHASQSVFSASAFDTLNARPRSQRRHCTHGASARGRARVRRSGRRVRTSSVGRVGSLRLNAARCAACDGVRCPSLPHWCTAFASGCAGAVLGRPSCRRGDSSPPPLSSDSASSAPPASSGSDAQPSSSCAAGEPAIACGGRRGRREC